MLQSSIHGGLYIMDRNLTHNEEGVGVDVRNYVETLCILNLVSFYFLCMICFRLYVLAFTLTKSFYEVHKRKVGM